MSLTQYVHAMGRGPSKGRSLTIDEARDAMAQMLSGQAAPEAVGALLMLMRYRGETPDEVAGFTLAARAGLEAWQETGAALDWPSYAAGRSRGLPWFLLSALLVARAGYPVAIHGWNSHQNPVASVREAVHRLPIPITGRADCLATALERNGIAYIPLETLCLPLLGLLRLRDVLGLRSAVNTVCRMLNPTAAPVSVQGVFHPPYRGLQQDAGALLGDADMMILKGGGGEFERHPGKAIELYGLRAGERFVETAPPRVSQHRRLAAGSEGGQDHLLAVWQGRATDAWGEDIVIGTAAAALTALGACATLAAAEDRATQLWYDRHQRLAA